MMQLANMTEGTMLWWIGAMIIMWFFIWFVVSLLGKTSNNHYHHERSSPLRPLRRDTLRDKSG